MILYKYLPPERIDVLAKGCLRFTQPAAFNDPFESLPCFESIKPNSDRHREILARVEAITDREWYLINPLTLRETSKQEYIARLKDDPSVVEILAFSPQPRIKSIVDGLYQNPSNTLGVLSLSEKLDSLPMWAHYTENHAGFVLGFDTSHAWFQSSVPDPFRQPKKVRYSDDRPRLSNLAVTATEHLLTKSREWEYEQEWRMIAFLDDAQTTIEADPWPIHLFDFPPECLVSLHLGYRMLPAMRMKLSEGLAASKGYSNLQTYFGYVSRETFMFNFMEVAF